MTAALPTNADVRWDGTPLGLVPSVTGDAARQAMADRDAAVPRLVAALDDPDRFVAAHVLLSFITGAPHDPQPWNGLQVELLADGSTRINAGQRHALARRWRKWRQQQQPGR